MKWKGLNSNTSFARILKDVIPDLIGNLDTKPQDSLDSRFRGNDEFVS